jgi:nitroreductase
MDFDEGIRKRKMVREYDQDKQISDKIIMKLMSNAHRAPVQVIHRFRNLS